MNREEFTSFLISWGFNGTKDNKERLNEAIEKLLITELRKYNNIEDDGVVVCKECGNDNIDDGKHKYHMERCDCCLHYL
jgi:hypothetical protein